MAKYPTVCRTAPRKNLCDLTVHCTKVGNLGLKKRKKNKKDKVKEEREGEEEEGGEKKTRLTNLYKSLISSFQNR